jgi:hypothetical protein
MPREEAPLTMDERPAVKWRTLANGVEVKPEDRVIREVASIGPR